MPFVVCVSCAGGLEQGCIAGLAAGGFACYFLTSFYSHDNPQLCKC